MTLNAVGFYEVVAVTGHRRTDVEAALAGTGVRSVFNPNYAAGEMLSSIQAGISAVHPGADAILVCLGDQPQMQAATVETILVEGERTGWQQVIIPSYRMRAGHPILIPSSLRLQIMDATESLRVALRAGKHRIKYVDVETATILADLDTPADYAASGQAAAGRAATGNSDRSEQPCE